MAPFARLAIKKSFIGSDEGPMAAGIPAGSGIAKQKKGDAASGMADIAAAKAIEPDIVERMTDLGIK